MTVVGQIKSFGCEIHPSADSDNPGPVGTGKFQMGAKTSEFHGMTDLSSHYDRFRVRRLSLYVWFENAEQVFQAALAHDNDPLNTPSDNAFNAPYKQMKTICPKGVASSTAAADMLQKLSASVYYAKLILNNTIAGSSSDTVSATAQWFWYL